MESAFETGKRELSMGALMAYADYFGASTDWILNGKSDEGDSATGKTTLIEMINQYQNLGMSSGIELICDVPCRTLAGTDWKMILSSVHENIKTHKYSLGFLSILELRLCFLKIIIFAL